MDGDLGELLDCDRAFLLSGEHGTAWHIVVLVAVIRAVELSERARHGDSDEQKCHDLQDR